MTTDITELMQREKFEAWVMTQICISKSTLEGLRSADGYRNSTLSGTNYNRMWNCWKAAGAELVEALEKAQHRIDELENDEVRQRLANAEHQLYMAELAKHNLKASRKAQFRKRRAAEKRIAELEEAEQKLCAANVTLDARAELAERQLAELESRTVKLPQAVSAGGQGYQEQVERILTAAGIKVEAE
ncbi:hypothetical protein [Klebsiella aerogenes]|uniref:hypothetical protein n=1 Tax=Klebsiella aerogenes TaxID=548 RepID=UPI002D7EEB9D|nr:hypothetical protein [Klebsiella aerogenes]